ncbi:hypothetical protein J7L05_09535 [bacterium]|nr:hypothetical protein [bacterium]
MTVEERIERLEKMLGASSGQADIKDEIWAKKLVITDEDEVIRAMLTVVDDEPGLVIFGKDGNPRVMLTDYEGEPSLTLRDNNGEVRAKLCIFKDEPGLSLRNKNGEIIFNLP